MNAKNNGKEILLKQMENKYKYYNANSFGWHNFSLEESLFENYAIFRKTFDHLDVDGKLNDLMENYNFFVKKNKDEEENDKIYEEIEALSEKYNNITKELHNNLFYYAHLLDSLSIKYQKNCWNKEIGKICYSSAAEINKLLNNKYINYENKLVLIVDKINILNLKLIPK